MRPSTLRALVNLHGFGWIYHFQRWPSKIRMPVLLGPIVILAMGLNFIGLPVERIVNTAIAISFILSTLALWIIMADNAEVELSTLLHNVDSEKYLNFLQPGQTTAKLETLLGILFGIANLTSLHLLSEAQGLWVFDYLLQTNLINTNPAMYLFSCIALTVMVFGGVVTVHLLFFLFRHYKAYLRLALEIPLNLFELEKAQLVSRPLLRYWLLVILVATLYTLFSQFSSSDGSQHEIFARAVVIPLFITLTLMSWLFIKPVWIIRERVRGMKNREIQLLRLALTGDRSSLAQTQIADIADEFSAPDLLYYEDRVEKLWEWPIRQEMQRIAFYTLIPPAAWIMAALVERMLDTLL